MKNLKNNKGFSLVELIIVIAIMAVLIGILAPQYLKYVERSRISADGDYLDSVRKAVEAAIADPNVNTDANSTVTITDNGVTFTDTQDLADEVAKIVDVPASVASGEHLFKSNGYRNQTGGVIINVIADGDGDGTADDPRVEFDSANGLIQ